MLDIVGVNRRGMPSEHCPDHGVDYLCVLVQGEDNDVAAYLGVGSAGWVARSWVARFARISASPPLRNRLPCIRTFCGLSGQSSKVTEAK